MTVTLASVARNAIRAARPGSPRDLALAANPPPAELDYLVSRIGAAATLALIEEAGGTRIGIPKTVTPTSRIARIVGLDGARALAAWRGTEQIKVPLARHWRIRIYRAEGETYTAIARSLGITEKAVHENLRAARMTDQPDLFEAG